MAQSGLHQPLLLQALQEFEAATIGHALKDRNAEEGDALATRLAFIRQYNRVSAHILFENAIFLHKLALTREVLDGYAVDQCLNPAEPSSAALLHQPDVSADLRTQAEHALRAALALRPDFARAALSLGVMLAERGDVGGATTMLRRAAEVQDLEAQANAVLARLGHYEGGLLPDRPAGDALPIADALRQRGEWSRCLYFYGQSLEPSSGFRSDFDPAAPPHSSPEKTP